MAPEPITAFEIVLVTIGLASLLFPIFMEWGECVCRPIMNFFCCVFPSKTIINAEIVFLKTVDNKKAEKEVIFTYIEHVNNQKGRLVRAPIKFVHDNTVGKKFVEAISTTKKPASPFEQTHKILPKTALLPRNFPNFLHSVRIKAKVLKHPTDPTENVLCAVQLRFWDFHYSNFNQRTESYGEVFQALESHHRDVIVDITSDNRDVEFFKKTRKPLIWVRMISYVTIQIVTFVITLTHLPTLGWVYFGLNILCFYLFYRLAMDPGQGFWDQQEEVTIMMEQAGYWQETSRTSTTITKHYIQYAAPKKCYHCGGNHYPINCPKVEEPGNVYDNRKAFRQQSKRNNTCVLQ
jgi:hypothetical protein